MELKGWICPRCDASNALMVSRCDCSPAVAVPMVPFFYPAPEFPERIDPWTPVPFTVTWGDRQQ